MKNEMSQDDVIKLASFIGGASVAPIALYLIWAWKREPIVRIRLKGIAIRVGLTLVVACVWFLFLDAYTMYRPDYLYHHTKHSNAHLHLGMAKLFWLWALMGVWVRYLVPLMLILKKKSPGLRVRDFKYPPKDFTAIKRAFQNPTVFPLGLDVKNHLVCGLSDEQRRHHMLIAGATGSGKTVWMVLMILHAIKHGRPCVIIDPKGDDSTLREIINLGRKLDPQFDKRFHLFSMSRPEQSCKYNPLKHGNANQLKDRIMEALNWSEQHYANMAGEFLTDFTAVIKYLGIELNLKRLSRILLYKEEQAKLQKMILVRQKKGDEDALELWNKLQIHFSQSHASSLAGLQAQISILDNPTFGKLLSFETADREIDLRDIRKTNGIAYFQLNTLGNGDSARRLGRMVIEDLKALTAEIYDTESDESKRRFFPVFIDEFGSFAAKEFIEFLKQSRGARMGVHLFSQGFEDLDVVSKEFRRQVKANCGTTASMRVTDSETVEEMCSTAGTMDTLEQSYQVEGNLVANKTGMGNMRETKQMKIEHDVIKQLHTGQAVVIQSSPQSVSGIQICRAKEII